MSARNTLKAKVERRRIRGFRHLNRSFIQQRQKEEFEKQQSDLEAGKSGAEGRGEDGALDWHNEPRAE